MTRLRATLAALLSGLFLASPAPGAAPELISYQGVLTLSSGLVAPDGLYGLRFQIFDQASNGNPVLPQPIGITVDVRDGLYNVILPIAADAFAEGTRFMEVAIVSGPAGIQPAILTPRQQIASVPYALVARSADAVASPSGEPAIPIGAIILWDQAAGCENEIGACPCGFEEETAFRGMTIRGADTGHSYPGIPDVPGDPEGTPDGTGAYGDRLTIAEMPAHDHPGSSTTTTRP